MQELVAGFDRLFEPTIIRNDRFDYARTVSCWLQNLRSNRNEAVTIVGDETVTRYERFLEAGMKAHESGVFLLLRLGLKKLG
jgi:cyclopropane fatty-acyl-phospholipid synthase-like methyltransferase